MITLYLLGVFLSYGVYRGNLKEPDDGLTIQILFALLSWIGFTAVLLACKRDTKFKLL